MVAPGANARDGATGEATQSVGFKPFGLRGAQNFRRYAVSSLHRSQIFQRFVSDAGSSQEVRSSVGRGSVRAAGWRFVLGSDGASPYRASSRINFIRWRVLILQMHSAAILVRPATFLIR